MFQQPNMIEDAFIEGFLPDMPLERQDKALKYRHKIDRNMCVMGYWLLCYGLRREYNIFDCPRFSYNEYGKPSLTDYPNIHFSISHCRMGVVCAVSQEETGIDIQDIRPYDPDIAKRICTNGELEQLALHPRPEYLFCRLWTIKESHIKMFGASLECLENKADAEWLMSQAPGYVYTYWGERYHLCCFGIENKIVAVDENELGEYREGQQKHCILCDLANGCL